MFKIFYRILLVFSNIVLINVHGIEKEYDYERILVPDDALNRKTEIYTRTYHTSTSMDTYSKSASGIGFQRAGQQLKANKASKQKKNKRIKGKKEIWHTKEKVPKHQLVNKRATFYMKTSKRELRKMTNRKKWPKVKLKNDDELSYTRIFNFSLLRENNKPEEEELQFPDVIDPYEKYTQINPYDILNNLVEIFKSFSKAYVTAEVIGRTVEYKDIVLLKIVEKLDAGETFWRANHDKFDNEANEKKKIFIVHGLSTMGMQAIPCLYIENQFKQLISFYLDHLKDFDIFIIPLANPDGFAKGGFYWNKNVSPQQDCGGVALDHNFDIGWDYNHTISSCSQYYPGPRPFSEAESQAVKAVLHKYATKIIAYIHVSAVNNPISDYRGDAVLYPNGFTDLQSDEDKYIDLKGEIDEAMSNASFKSLSVTVDTMYSWYGKVSGKSVDYASQVYGIPFAMEFLMYPYINDFNYADYVEMQSHAALVQIWKRVIDAVFNYIRKSIITPDESE